ncbi:MAG: response regulator [Bdellovibrionia bacterium]
MSNKEMANILTKKRMLIVEDNSASLKELEDTLNQGECQFDKAQSGDQAIRLIQSTRFDLVLTEVKLPDVSGLDFLKWINENYKIPVVLMSESKDIMDTINFAALGAAGFLKKPFISKELFQTLESCFPSSEYPDINKDSIESNYCRLSLDDFVIGTRLKFDMYFKVRDSKFLRISCKGEEIDIHRANTYKEKNTQYLYVRKEDYIKSIDFIPRSRNNFGQPKALIERKKIEALKNAAESTIQSLFKNGINQEDYLYAEALVMNALNILTDDSETLGILNSLLRHASFLYTQSVGVSLYSVLIARGMKIRSLPVLFKLAVSGLLHDIGKKTVPMEILAKNTLELPPVEKEIFNRYPTEGVKLLARLEYIAPEVVLIIHQHHKNRLGEVFLQSDPEKVHPLVRILSLASEFCNLTVKNPRSEGVGFQEAISKISTDSLSLDSEDNQEPLQALKKVIQLVTPTRQSF